MIPHKETLALRMVLKPGQAELYRKRHDEIWPDLSKTLKDAGISEYRIFLDPETNHLFAILQHTPDHHMDILPKTEIVQRWWQFMADIMETHPNNVPTQVTLEPMFYLP